MAEITIKTVKISQIQLNPDNPRTITGPALDKLIKSLKDFPEMMELREIVVDETMTVLGGNMRLLALQKSGVKNCTAKIVKGLTPEQKREFIIKDNAAFGDWDFDLLANEWGELPLIDWGIDLPKNWLKEQIDQEDIDKVKDNLRHGILITVGFCDILVSQTSEYYESLFNFCGKYRNFTDDEKDIILKAVANVIKQ